MDPSTRDRTHRRIRVGFLVAALVLLTFRLASHAVPSLLFMTAGDLVAILAVAGAFLAIRRSLTASERAHEQLALYARELERSNQDLQAVVRAQQEVATLGLDRDSVLQAITARTQELTHGSGAVVEWLEGEEMVCRAASGACEPLVGQRLPADASLSGLCARTRRNLRCDDAETDPRVDRETARRVGARSMILVPLTGPEGGRGVLKVVSPEPNAFSRRDVSALQLMAGLTDAALRDASAFEAEQVLLREAELHRRELERSNQDLQEFAYVASHDLQEPLRKIQAFGDRLRTRYAHSLDDQGVDYLTRMQSAAARMQNLIQDLLTLSRVSTRPDDFVATDLGVVTAEVIGDLGERIESTGGQIETGSLPVVVGDPTQIRQLLQNLMGNALKYARPDTPPLVRISASTVRGVARIEIADNGIGFEQEYAERIFAPFQRLHGRGEYDGTGIGLAICRKIVERHGGEIGASGAPGAGAIFTFTLPLKRARQAA